MCKTSTHAEYAPLQHLLQNTIVVRVNVYAALVTIRIFNEKVYLSHVLFSLAGFILEIAINIAQKVIGSRMDFNALTY